MIGFAIDSARRTEDDVFNFKLSSNLILICTQTFMQDDFIPYIKWLSKDLLEKKLNYKIIVKHHPVEKRETYQSLLSLENVLLCDYNLSFLFETCKIHISIYSTTLFDALQYNLHNFTLESSFSEDYRSEIIKDKIARPIKRNENPVLLLKEQETEKVDAGYFYAPFSQEKLKKILNYK